MGRRRQNRIHPPSRASTKIILQKQTLNFKKPYSQYRQKNPCICTKIRRSGAPYLDNNSLYLDNI